MLHAEAPPVLTLQGPEEAELSTQATETVGNFVNACVSDTEKRENIGNHRGEPKKLK